MKPHQLQIILPTTIAVLQACKRYDEAFNPVLDKVLRETTSFTQERKEKE